MTALLQLGRLDFLYTPSMDVASATAFVEAHLGGRVVFTIEDMGTRVAMIELGEAPPFLMFADHLAGEAPIHVYQVPNLEEATSQLNERDLHGLRTLEIPQGPCCSFRTPEGLRMAVYQLTRPQVETHFHGRRDF